MDKKSAKYWAYSEVLSEAEGMINDFDSRGGHKKVSSELIIYVDKLRKQFRRMTLPKHDFKGREEK